MHFYEKELQGIKDRWEKTHPERVEKFTKQYLEQGFTDEDTWSLDSRLTALILPRLVRYRELINNRIVIDWPLDEIIAAFQKLNDEGLYSFKDEEWDLIDNGLASFAKHYRRHWW